MVRCGETRWGKQQLCSQDCNCSHQILFPDHGRSWCWINRRSLIKPRDLSIPRIEMKNTWTKLNLETFTKCSTYAKDANAQSGSLSTVASRMPQPELFIARRSKVSRSRIACTALHRTAREVRAVREVREVREVRGHGSGHGWGLASGAENAVSRFPSRSLEDVGSS